MTDLSAIQAELEAAEAAVAEAEAVQRRLDSALTLKEAASKLLLEARVSLGDERQDVAALESFSPTRIWAALRGTRLEDLDREQAEVRAGEYAVAELETRLRAIEVGEASLSARAAELAGAAERRRLALAAKEELLLASGGDAAVELTRIAAEMGAAETELKEVSEAFEAATDAASVLEDAATMLGKASDWAGVDTWLGGGLLTDSIKYDRMDQATTLLRRADAAIGRLAKELGDLGREGVAGPQVTNLTQAFDVWFDNIFSDMAVSRRIHEADERARRAFHEVAGVRRGLFARREELTAAVVALRTRREELLRG
ncbi:hypothetical protein GCM10009798_00870 [Nocardioides panacihumi]|uniref:Uncharacterized protein n=1 Tax=Nocardioides panacihumi TaxID=400774 RepID=A0ABN2Q974_9ACTN